MEKSITEGIQPSLIVDFFKESNLSGPLTPEDSERVDILRSIVETFPLHKPLVSNSVILPIIYNNIGMSILTSIDQDLKNKFINLSQKKFIDLIVYTYLSEISEEEKESYMSFFGIEIDQEITEETPIEA